MINLDVIGVDDDGGDGMGLSQVSGMTISPAHIRNAAAVTLVCNHTPACHQHLTACWWTHM